MEEKTSSLIDDLLAAEHLDLAVQTLRNWRYQGIGPAYLKLGRCVRYQIEDIEAYKRKKRINPKNEQAMVNGNSFMVCLEKEWISEN